ncbi:MAG: ROK family protein [Chloroflexi bacterium]|nr:ROK family protein [Chloroflexota bacterium]
MKKNARTRYAVSGDIGGTQMRAALVDQDGNILAKTSTPTEPAEGFPRATERFIGILRDSVRGVAASDVVAVGVSSAGPIDPETGVYYNPPNLHGWDRKTMRPALERAFDVPVVIGHDARVAAIAEMRWGAARGMKNVIYVTVSTGIGGGIIVDGRPVVGVKGLAGEVGHIVVEPDGPSCNGGCRGCVEVIASGEGMANEARKRIAAGARSLLLKLSEGDPSRINGRMVFEAAAQGDQLALDLIQRGIGALGQVLGGLLNTFSPEILIVGGSVGADGYRPYWADLDAAVRKSALLRYREKAPLAVSHLGDEVSLLGAAAIAFAHVES